MEPSSFIILGLYVTIISYFVYKWKTKKREGNINYDFDDNKSIFSR